MYRNLIIEPTNTLIFSDPAEFFMDLYLNKAAEIDMRALTVDSPVWHRMELGELSFGAARAEILKQADEQNRLFEAITFFEHWDSFYRVSARSYHFLRRLKEQGVRLYYLGNLSAVQRDLLLDRVGANFFQDGIVSCDYHADLPSPKAFAELIHRNYLLENEVLYLTPNTDALQMALDYGITSLQFTNIANFAKTAADFRLFG